MRRRHGLAPVLIVVAVVVLLSGFEPMLERHAIAACLLTGAVWAVRPRWFA